MASTVDQDAPPDQHLDLDRYLNRVGIAGDLRPDLDTLQRLLSAHMSRIPFENLDVLLGRGVRIDLASLQAKLVHDQRGGYCFEHATLFAAVLERLGFVPLRHAARVTLLMPRHDVPRTHMFLSVPLPEGRFVVDPGFGGLAPSVPLLVPERGGPVPDPRRDGRNHWLAREGNDWTLRAATDGKIVDCWVSNLGVEYPVDFEMANHYTSTHRSSGFVNRLMMRALTADGRVTVTNRDVTIVRGTRLSTSRLEDRAALRSLVVEYFGFDLPALESLRVPAIPEWD